MQTKRDSLTAVQAAILARLIHGEAARAMIEQAERVAQAVETERQQAILWLHQTLTHETVTCMILKALGFDRLLVDAADTLSIRYRESVRDYAKRIAACDDTDVLAVAVALIENQIKEGVEHVEHQDGTLASWKKARRVLKRATDALANQQPGYTPPAGGVADNRPTAPALRSALMQLTDHTTGAREWGGHYRPATQNRYASLWTDPVQKTGKNTRSTSRNPNCKDGARKRDATQRESDVARANRRKRTSRKNPREATGDHTFNVCRPSRQTAETRYEEPARRIDRKGRRPD